MSMLKILMFNIIQQPFIMLLAPSTYIRSNLLEVYERLDLSLFIGSMELLNPFHHVMHQISSYMATKEDVNSHPLTP
jgi:hypothetical protein